MAESRWERTGPDGIARAEVRNLTPVSPDDVRPVVRDDGHAYGPLTNPAAPSLPGYSPPSPAIPSQQELREQLQAALAEQHIADTALVDAEAAHARAQRHLERAGCDLDRYGDLDSSITTALADMLRGGDPDMHDDGELMTRTTERERARVAYAAAGHAAELLAKELTAARGRAAEAAASVDRLIAAVLVIGAERVAEKHEALLAEAAQVREMLLAFDHFASNKGVHLTQRIRGVLGHNMQDFARKHDQAVWRDAAAMLKSDPMAEVEIK